MTDEAGWAQEETKQSARQQLIRELVARRVFTKVEYEQWGATAWVGPVFYDLGFEDKQSSCSVIGAYISVRNRNEALNVVSLRDVTTGKTIGEYKGYWGGLKMN